MKKSILLVILLVFSLTLACSLSNTTPEVSSPGDTGPGPTAETILVPTPIPSDPVSIRVGLASLNSYVLVIETTFTGPGEADYSLMRYEVKSNSNLDATSIHTYNASSSQDYPELEESDSYTYSIGNASCSGSEVDGWEYTENDPQTQEMMDLFSQMVDILPLIENPTYAGSENINGVETNHFTFQVSGLGLESGAQVNINQGDYWLAQDGQYLVRYHLITETTNPNDLTTLHMEFLIDLTEINQPVEITFPSGCVP